MCSRILIFTFFEANSTILNYNSSAEGQRFCHGYPQVAQMIFIRVDDRFNDVIL